MSQQHADLWNTVAAAWDQRISAVSAEQMETATPCSDWNVQALVEHAVGTQISFAGGTVGADIAEGAEWPAVHAAISAAIEDPSVLGEMTEHPMMGTVPKAMLFGIATTDLLIHTWDLARATGGDEQLPAQAIGICHQGLQMFPPEVMRQEGFFGPAVESAADADAQTQFLNFAGRTV